MALTVVFQPHLFSRTRDLANEFAAVLSLADHVVLLPIYPARELPMEGVTSHLIAEKMETAKVVVLEKDAWIESLEKVKPPLLVTAGAGDIDALLPIVKEKLMMN
jgi:UDP-N-acetylmuramate--alanine ligase